MLSNNLWWKKVKRENIIKGGYFLYSFSPWKVLNGDLNESDWVRLYETFFSDYEAFKLYISIKIQIK